MWMMSRLFALGSSLADLKAPRSAAMFHDVQRPFGDASPTQIGCLFIFAREWMKRPTSWIALYKRHLELFKSPSSIHHLTYRLVLAHLMLLSSEPINRYFSNQTCLKVAFADFGGKLTAIPPLHGFPASLQIPKSAELGNSHGGFFLRLKGWHTWGYINLLLAVIG